MHAPHPVCLQHIMSLQSVHNPDESHQSHEISIIHCVHAVLRQKNPAWMQCHCPALTGLAGCLNHPTAGLHEGAPAQRMSLYRMVRTARHGLEWQKQARDPHMVLFGQLNDLPLIWTMMLLCCFFAPSRSGHVQVECAFNLSVYPGSMCISVRWHQGSRGPDCLPDT